MEVRPAAFVALFVAVAIGVSGCGGSKPSPDPTVTASASAGTAVRTGSGSAGGGSSTSASPKPTSTTSLHGTCDDVLPLDAVEAAAGVTIVGKTEFVVNEPDSSTGQVERINCRYGVSVPAAGSTDEQVKVEVSITLYSTDKQATDRVVATQNEWRGLGATPHSVSVSGHPATILTGNGPPLLVLASGPRTVAVTMAADLVPAEQLDGAMTAVAARALSGAGG